MSKSQPQGFFNSCYVRLRAYLRKGAEPAPPALPVPPALPIAGATDKEQAEFERALAFHQQGKLDEAESIYRMLLQQQPNHADALHFFGVLQAQRQNLTEAVELIGRAIEINPDNAAAHSNYGNVLKGLKRNEDALASYNRAIALNPEMVETINNRGAVLGELGRHDEALASYESTLTISSEYVDALSNRGISLTALKRYQEALVSFDRALAVTPTNADALSNRGSVLVALERHDEALTSYDRALAVKPEYADALFNRGSVLVALGRYDEALASYDSALSVKPDYQEALHKRCATLMTLKRFDEALASYDHALDMWPDDIEALFNLGLVQVELNRYADAVASYDKVILIKPDFAEAFNNRGMALWRTWRYEDAVTSYDHALAIRPEYAEAHCNRGTALSSLNRHAEAIASYDRAIVFNPQYADAFNNRGTVLLELKRNDEALASYDHALEIKPDYADALNNRGGIFRTMGLHERAAQDYSRLIGLDPEFEQALGNKVYSNVQACNWKQYWSDIELLVDAVRDGRRAALPFSFLVMSDSGAAQLRCAQTFVAHKFPLAGKALWAGERYQHERIRIAYLSADLHQHATAYLTAELFEKHDKSQFEVSAWSFGPDPQDDMRERLKKSFEQFNDVSQKSDVEVATMLRAQEIDIAIDLKGFTGSCRTAIFAHRAVPIQVNYLGYPGTMGADYMDYIIGDAEVIPAEHDAHYAEKVVRLPDTYQVNDSKRVISDCTPSRVEAGLPQSGVVFCCFNNNYKIIPDVFEIWMRLLKQVEGSVLWLLEDNPAASRNLRSEAESRGVRAERLVFAPRVPLADHLARHWLADLFLDTLPCNAHTTASDALWAGLPVLTCRGNAFPGRVAASLLRAIGLPELITDNHAEYEALAFKLATTPAMLNDLKAKLARNRNTYPLFDTDRFRRHIESAYTTMYERYQRGEPPQNFSVQAIP